MAKETNSPLSEVAQSPKIAALVEDSANYDPFRSGSSTRSSRSNTAYLSSPDLDPVDPRTPILEEEEDELLSDTVDEPTTPADDGSEQGMGDPLKSLRPANTLGIDIPAPAPANSNTLPTPGPARPATSSDKSPEHVRTPSRKKSRSKRSSLRRSVSNLFKRTNSQHGTSLIPASQSLRRNSRSDPTSREPSPMPRRYTSGTTSPNTTRPTSPSLPGTPDNGLYGAQTPVNFQEPDSDSSPTRKRKIRSSPGFSLREALHLHSPKKISFMPDEKFSPARRNRASSADSYADPRIRKTSSPNPDVLALQQHMWGMNASSGVGLKARRLSQSIPDDFDIFPTELYDDYSDQSKLPGRRGKALGEGATANVKLMTGKDSPNDLYAVKEFRRKGKRELSIDYEKKVKSEFSIAKSVQHPNIVKTFSLCTHNGRWNHVMEFCEQGDLFSLVQKHYLSDDQHLKDRLCLFKQLVQGIHYLHEHGIAHRDIKLENLLITDQGHLKITDFGVSEVFSGIHPGLRSAEGQCGKEMDDEVRLCAPGICGSPPYIAPEVISKQGDYDPRPIDVWSAAIVMISMTANGTLWNEARPESSAVYDSLIDGWAKWDARHESCSDQHDITESDYPHIPFFDNFINPPALRRILLTMLNPDPNKRVSMHEVANNRWLKNVECCQLDVSDEMHGGFDARRVSSNGKGATKMKKVQHPHNHLPPTTSLGHRLVRLPGSTEV